MSKKHFSLLAALTALAAIVAFLVPSQTSRDNGFEPAPLLPGLEARVNDVEWLRVSAEGAAVATLARSGDEWVVDEAGGYRADWPKVHQLLSALAAAEIVELKTANPAYYARLGVEEPDSPGAGSVLVEFAEGTGLPAVIAGNRAQGRDGQYMRLEGSEQSLLIDRELDLPRATEDWIERVIADISAEEVVEAAVTHPDGEGIVISKVSADDENFELLGVPEGMEPKSEWAVDSLAGGLDSLELDGVAPAADIDWNGQVTYRVVTADGLDLEAGLVTAAGEGEGAESHWIRLEAGLYTTAVGGAGEEAAAETTARAEEMNSRVAGWAYRIPQYKYDAMVKRMDDLLQEAETDE